MPSYGIDTSVLVRLLTGEPAADFEATVSKLVALRATRTEPILAANIVIAEAYAAVQHHYGVSKEEARRALRSVLTSGLIEPAAGAAVLEALDAAKEPGLTDRLILIDHAQLGAVLLTHDRKLAGQTGAQRL